MKKLLSTLALISALGLGVFGVTSVSYADDTKAVATAVEVAPATDAAAVVPAAPVAADEVAATPVSNKGDIAWMIMATVLVTLMVIPGLGLFYGGLVRSKNMLSILMQTFVIFSLIGVLWALYGYSVAFTDGNAFFGGLSKAFLQGITPDSVVGTFSKGVVIPEYIYVAFQMTFAAITPALIVGAFAERIKFSAVLLFVVLWFTFSYLPIAHMVWFWAGPDAYTTKAAADAATAGAGFLFQKGALDFAGGTVVHINAGIAALVGSIMLGRRLGYGREAMTPHSLTMTMIGASLLWVGWFGFNVGSNLEATGFAGLVFVNTLLATCAATLSWTFVEWITKGKPSMLGGVSGAVAGLVAITPACGFAGPMGAIVLGLVVSPICFLFVSKVKSWFGYDDSLDVFGVHGVGGIVGAIGTGIVVNPAFGGTGVYDYVANAVGSYDMLTQVTSQAWGVGVTVVWSTVVAVVAYKIVDLVVGLRVSEEMEREGLDTSEHGERAYHV
ncbi:ammonium transporter [Candidatus Methylopumilus turicensis]|uniref:Ammonium transporter n=1 Tax=Candidatus Methylopumilus turicensis TaxID=1581680 RepID=A0A0B7IX00_9PROT|nr:ammonium transporter [Candidatus Methylopumilus turicensis]CEN56731.1 ammonium transporter [Candidatus Methylopumilus turicensis]